ncbi:MAG: tetratricopeptide repeat protein [Nitrospinae bacterium]|nr:tetratricopeptide repeat protein [Nitrospinota bacterium]
MSLIADSLKRALKEGPGFQVPASKINLLKSRKSGRGKPGTGTSSFLRFFILVLLPAGILAYLVWAGAFDQRKTKLVDLPIWRNLGLIEEKTRIAKASPAAPPNERLKRAPLPEPAPIQSPASLKKKSLIPAPKKIPDQGEARPLKEIVEGFRDKYADEFVQVEPEAKQIAPPKKRVFVTKSGTTDQLVKDSGVGDSVVSPPVREEQGLLSMQDRSPPVKPRQPLKDTMRQESVPVLKLEPKPKFSGTPDPEIFKNGDYYFNTAVFYQQSHDWEKALSNYAKAAEMDADNADIYNNMGLIYKELGQYGRAIEEFMRTVYLDPDYAKAYNNIGVVYYIQKNYNGAIQNYRKAIDINRNNLEALNNLAITYKAQNQIEKANAVLQQAILLDPRHPGTNYNMAVLFEAKGNLRAALHHYRRFVETGKMTHPALTFEVEKHIEQLAP